MTDGAAAEKPKSLLERLDERYWILRAKDPTIRKYQNEMNRQADKMRHAYQLKKICRLAQREHEKWLREEAAVQIRKETGVRTIPGFNSRRESAIAFRQALNEKTKQATAAAKAIIQGTQ